MIDIFILLSFPEHGPVNTKKNITICIRAITCYNDLCTTEYRNNNVWLHVQT